MNDNVRKVFDMLGVEPNEIFKVEGNGDTIYYIDTSLCVYRNEGVVCGCLNYLINGDFKIIKLPKEPKKKKLRDLTIEEYKKWSDKKCKGNICDKCIFNNVVCSIEDCSWVNHKELYSDTFLNKEIEVEE